MCGSVDEHTFPQRPEDGAWSPGSGNAGDCELPKMGAGTQTQVLWKSSKHSKPVSDLSNS